MNNWCWTFKIIFITFSNETSEFEYSASRISRIKSDYIGLAQLISNFEQMKKLFLLLFIVFPAMVFSQNIKVIYFGVNGKTDNIQKKDIMKEIKIRSKSKAQVKTYKAKDDEWIPIYSEKISIVNDSVYNIKMKGDEFSGKIRRVFELQEDGTWKFTDWLGETIKRTGITTSKIPLIFDGEVTEFYPLGRIKSISQYKNNQLVSNKNWMPNGDESVDNIFYSVDREPRYNPGLGRLHQHVLKTFKDYDFDLATVEGRILVGFVVKTDGTIDGIRIIKGIAPTVNQIALNAFQTVEGAWTPAKIENDDVNYFQVFPINFIYNVYDFETLELKGSMLYWTIN